MTTGGQEDHELVSFNNLCIYLIYSLALVISILLRLTVKYRNSFPHSPNNSFILTYSE